MSHMQEIANLHNYTYTGNQKCEQVDFDDAIWPKWVAYKFLLVTARSLWLLGTICCYHFIELIPLTLSNAN